MSMVLQVPTACVCLVLPGSFRSYFRGNGANVVKIAPETALKLTLNDTLKQVFAHDPENIRASERFVCGGVAGALAQVRACPYGSLWINHVNFSKLRLCTCRSSCTLLLTPRCIVHPCLSNHALRWLSPLSRGVGFTNSRHQCRQNSRRCTEKKQAMHQRS